MKRVWVRFECGSEDRTSKDYGPFDYLQMVYLTLTSTDGVEIAYYNSNQSEWKLVLDLEAVKKATGVEIDLDDANLTWTDVVIWGGPE